MHLTLVFQERFALHEKYGESRQHSIFDAVVCRITGKPWVFDFSDRFFLALIISHCSLIKAGAIY